MNVSARGMLLTLAVIVLGIAMHPIAIGAFSSRIGETTVSLPLAAIAALPFLASLGVLAITRESTLALASALGPLVASFGVHLLIVTGTNSYPLAALVLAPFFWINLLLVFPIGFWVSLRFHEKPEGLDEPSNTALERTRER